MIGSYFRFPLVESKMCGVLVVVGTYSHSNRFRWRSLTEDLGRNEVISL